MRFRTRRKDRVIFPLKRVHYNVRYNKTSHPFTSPVSYEAEQTSPRINAVIMVDPALKNRPDLRKPLIKHELDEIRAWGAGWRDAHSFARSREPSVTRNLSVDDIWYKIRTGTARSEAEKGVHLSTKLRLLEPGNICPICGQSKTANSFPFTPLGLSFHLNRVHGIKPKKMGRPITGPRASIEKRIAERLGELEELKKTKPEHVRVATEDEIRQAFLKYALGNKAELRDLKAKPKEAKPPVVLTHEDWLKYREYPHQVSPEKRKAIEEILEKQKGKWRRKNQQRIAKALGTSQTTLFSSKEYIRQRNHEYKKEYYAKKPWAKTMKRILGRINDPKRPDYFGLEKTIMLKDLKHAWQRDGAANMMHASIDRIDPTKGYIPGNIRYIELDENKQRERPRRKKK